MATCKWCGDYLDVSVYTINGRAVELCTNCLEAYNRKICISCGEADLNIHLRNGLCDRCYNYRKMIEEAERKKMIEALGTDDLSEISAPTRLSDEEYEKWMAHDSGIFKEEHKIKARMAVLRGRLKREYGWTDAIFDENYKDIQKLLLKYNREIIQRKYDLKLENQIAKTDRVIDRSGRIVCVE